MASLPPPARKTLLTFHVTTSVGWVGTVVLYLALGIAAVSSDDTELVRASYLVMDWAAWTVLVPLALASVSTGLVQSLTTPWGLFRHYWVLIKLAISLVATMVLLAYTDTLATFAEVATRATIPGPDLEFLRNSSVVVHATGALILLLTATVLAVFKPVGLTRHGHRQRQRDRDLRDIAP